MTLGAAPADTGRSDRSGGVRTALAGLTTRGRSFLAAGLAAAVCAYVLGQPDLLRVGMLLAAEAGRNPELPEAMRAKLDDMLGAMSEPSDPELPARTRVAFHKLLGSADAAAEQAKAAQAAQAGRKQPSVWDSLRGRK